MPISLLSQYIEIAKLLMEYGPQSISQIKSLMENFNPTNIEQVLDFLSKNKIITQKITGANRSYAIAERGIALLDFFRVKPLRVTIKLKR